MKVKINIKGEYYIFEVLAEDEYAYLIEYDGDWVWFLKKECDIIC